MKLFVVTFAGTMAANVATVMVVAVAVILATHPGRRPAPDAVPVYLALVALGIPPASASLIVFRRIRRGGYAIPRRIRARMVIATAVLGLTMLVSLLVLLGYAVGVK